MPSRRRYLRAGLGGLALLAGCTGREDPSTTPPTETTVGTTDTTTGTPTTDEPSGSDDPESDGPEPAGPWPTFRGDAANTGVAAAAGPTTEPSTLWRLRLRLDADAFPAAGPDGVYAPSGDGHLYALDADGGRRWRARIGPRPWTPAVTGDRVVVPTRDVLLAFDHEGESKWEAPGDGFFQQPTVLDGTVVAGTFHSGAVLVDAATGDRVGQVAKGMRAYAPVVDDGTAYVALRRRGDVGEVAAIGPDGGELWRADLPGEATSRVGLGGGRAYAGSQDGSVTALDAATGDEHWRTGVGDWVTRGPTVADGLVVAVTLARGVVALDADGEVRWRAPAVSAGTDPVVLGETVVVDDGDDELVGLDVADGSVAWRLLLDGPTMEGVHVADGRAVVGTDTGTVHAIDPAAGEEAWRATTKPRRFPSPVVGEKFVYAGSRGTETTGIAARKGRSKWRVDHPGWAADAPAVAGSLVVSGSAGGDLDATRAYDYPSPPLELDPDTDRGLDSIVDPVPAESVWTTDLDVPVLSSVTLADGRAVVGTDDGLAAVAADSGEVRWRASRDASVRSTPAVADRTVVAGDDAGRIAAHDFANGDELWSVGTGGPVVSSPAVRDGVVHVGSDDGVLYALGLADGAERWRYDAGGPVVSSPAVTPELAVVGSADGTVYAIDRSDGSERWSFETRGPVHSSPAVAGETVYVGSRDRHCYALGLADGRERWRFECENWVDSSPAVGFGAVFVADQDGVVYALVD